MGLKKVFIISSCYQDFNIPQTHSSSLLNPRLLLVLIAAIMHASLTSLAALGAIVQLLPGASAHGFVNLIKTGGKFYPGWDLNYYYQSNPPAVAGWSTTALDSGFVCSLTKKCRHPTDPTKLTNPPPPSQVSPDSYQTADIICHKSAKPGKTHIPVAAGSTVQLFWNTWPPGHSGPVIDYLAPCANNDCSSVDKSALKFAKIAQVGLKNGPAPGTWAVNDLVSNNNSWTVTIPSSLKAGAYVLRHEIVSLHAARSDNGAQNYPQCVNLSKC